MWQHAGVAANSDCIFCKILAEEIPSERVHSTDRTIAIRDINPQAPLHVLVIPHEHQPNAAASAVADATILAEMVSAAAAVAEAEGYADYNLVFNTGPEAGQTVFHTHLHLLAGKRLSSLPA